jgi:signal transduction histidine kinase
MSNRPRQNTDNIRQPVIPRLELFLVLATLILGAVFALSGVVIVGPGFLPSLVTLFLVAALFNAILLGLDRLGTAPHLVIWAARLGELALLTAGIYLTGGFDSPFFLMYAVYIAVASLRYGWRGAIRSFALCLLNWAILLILTPPSTLTAWARVGLTVGILGLVAMAVGTLAQRHLDSQQAVLQRDRELTFLHEAGRLLGTSLDPSQVLAITLAQVRELMDVEAASLALVDHLTNRVTLDLVVGGADEAVEGLRLEAGQGVVGQVIQHGEAMLVPDAATDPNFCSQVDQLSGYQTRSLLCVPLRVEGQVIGALEVLNKRGGPFTEDDTRLLSSMADLAAPAIENARLHDQVQQHVQKLQEAYDEVRRLDELKSTFIRNISHELRTPLALIQGYVELLLEGQLGPLRPEQQQSLALVEERALALGHMVNDFISLQTVGALGFDLKVLNPVKLVQAAAEAARPKAIKAGIEFELNLLPPDRVPSIKGDARRLGRAFDHLLDNAIKFSPNGGLVRLNMARRDQMIWVQVQDWGIGLATDQLERVFDRFYQVDGSATRHYGGTGLGLAFVKEVVEAHGGAVWAESTGIPGQGSVLNLFIPVFEDRCAESLL